MKDLIFLASQSGLIQYSASTSLVFRIAVAPPQTGQRVGGAILLLSVRFSAIWGIIILALYTIIRSPYPSFSAFTILTLCTDARLTVVPSSSTGSNMATGLISPVRLALHSISFNVVSACSSAHLKAMESLGNLVVAPSLRLYSRSSRDSTSPSDGISYVFTASSNTATASDTVSPVTIRYSTISNPWFFKNNICFSLE